ncbi:hypothetical protein [Bdellovibrio sp. HCB-162]|uniref:hypothetical protein n=1 Tax=Bdellovibrio sp. HCB-162 TaxID=3394234 RepID=UPI0039BD4B6D
MKASLLPIALLFALTACQGSGGKSKPTETVESYPPVVEKAERIDCQTQQITLESFWGFNEQFKYEIELLGPRYKYAETEYGYDERGRYQFTVTITGKWEQEGESVKLETLATIIKKDGAYFLFTPKTGAYLSLNRYEHQRSMSTQEYGELCLSK